MDVGQDLHEEAISNRDVLLLQVKQMAPLARAASGTSRTLVSSISAALLGTCVHVWVGGHRSTLYPAGARGTYGEQR